MDVWYKNNFISETTNELRVVEEAIHAYGQMAVIHITEHIYERAPVYDNHTFICFVFSRLLATYRNPLYASNPIFHRRNTEIQVETIGEIRLPFQRAVLMGNGFCVYFNENFGILLDCSLLCRFTFASGIVIACELKYVSCI